jgi:hypothetical protein
VIAPKQGIFVTGNVPKTLPPFPAVPTTRTGKTVPPLVIRTGNTTPPLVVRTGNTIPPLPARTGKTIPPVPVPHLNVSGATMDELDTSAGAGSPRGARRPLMIVAALVALIAAGSFGWRFYQAKRQASAKPAASNSAAAPEKSATPSETLNQIAQAPGNAINKAQDALAARRANEQTRVDAVVAGEDVPDRPVRKAPSDPAKKKAASSSNISTFTPVAPGLTASAPIEPGADAGAEFRLLVANLKIKGVFLGDPPRAVINGRLMRAGERVDSELGVTFEGLDADRSRLIFKDRTGATIQRKF